MRIATILAIMLALPAAPGLAEEPPVLVTDPAMCEPISNGEDVQEMGMILVAEGMYEIEYHCEFAEPLDIYWHEERTIVRAGYCAEPGFIHPTVFAIQMSDYEPGVVRIWEQGSEEPTVFHRCWEN